MFYIRWQKIGDLSGFKLVIWSGIVSINMVAYSV